MTTSPAQKAKRYTISNNNSSSSAWTCTERTFSTTLTRTRRATHARKCCCAYEDAVRNKLPRCLECEPALLQLRRTCLQAPLVANVAARCDGSLEAGGVRSCDRGEEVVRNGSKRPPLPSQPTRHSLCGGGGRGERERARAQESVCAYACLCVCV